jgi:predicted Zn-ribbon and HTH transcriptional regulator
MKRTKRLSIEIRHREVTFTVEGSAFHVQDRERNTPNPPTVCPTCGSPWIAIVARVDGDAPSNTDRIHHALEQSGVHLQVSPAGQLQICRWSFEELKEKL